MVGSYENMNLVGGFSPTHLKKYANVKLDHFPNFWGEDKKCLKPPPREKMAYGQSPNKIVLEFNPGILTMHNNSHSDA